MESLEPTPNLVRVDKIAFRTSGALILTGPSSCGKGEIASALTEIMSIPPEAHFSMGEILRSTITRAKSDSVFRSALADKHGISGEISIFSCPDTTPHLTEKVLSFIPQLEAYFGRDDMSSFTSQLEWLEFCTMNGLLVPNRWTMEFIAAHIEHFPLLGKTPIILDGYPRTVTAAKHLLDVLRQVNIPVLKVLHLSISRQEMLSRARIRQRADDDDASLLSRYTFYVESVQPSVDYLKQELGSSAISLIDAHQPVYREVDGERAFDLESSISNVVVSALRSLGVPRVVIRDLIEFRGSKS